VARLPVVPPNLPRRGNALTRVLGRALLAATGWRVVGEFPDQPKLVAIVAPHTSNWDFIVGIAAVFALDLSVRFLGKHTLFNPWLGWLMRWLGGVPVVRDTPQGAVGDAAALIAGSTTSRCRRASRSCPWRSIFPARPSACFRCGFPAATSAPTCRACSRSTRESRV
jgi:1-acyl-sn-glycerol-3-phosphate acyltransferase